MYDEKTKTLQLPDKRFVFLHKQMGLSTPNPTKQMFQHYIFDIENDVLFRCEETTPKSWGPHCGRQLFLIKHSNTKYYLPKLYWQPEDKCYDAQHIPYTNIQYLNGLKIIQIKMKNLGINFSITGKSVKMNSDEDRAMFEFYFGENIRWIK